MQGIVQIEQPDGGGRGYDLARQFHDEGEKSDATSDYSGLPQLVPDGVPPALAAERGALFKVSAKGHTMYLYGTIHAGLPGFYPLEPRIRKAVAAAPTLALEVDPLRDPAPMAAALQRAWLDAAAPATAGLPAERRACDRNGLKQQGIDPAAVAPFKPWMVATMLALVDLGKLGYDPAWRSTCTWRNWRARQGAYRRARIGGNTRRRCWTACPIEEQWRLLEETLETWRRVSSCARRARCRRLRAQCRPGRARRYGAHRIEPTTACPASFARGDAGGTQRPMADKLAALLARENNAVAAVGVLHLLGKQSVPALLRQRGLPWSGCTEGAAGSGALYVD
jgi:hypothetical protein